MRRKATTAGTRPKGLRGLIHDIRRSRGDTRGLTLSEPVIVILLIVLFSTAAVVAIVFFRGEGQKTVARVNLEAAVLAAKSVHNFSTDSMFGSTIAADLARVSPELDIDEVTSKSDADDVQRGATTAAVCSDTAHTTESACTTAGETWTPASSGTPQEPADMAVIVTDLDITGTVSSLPEHTGTAPWTIRAGDALWLLNRSDNGDTYCAFVVVEIEGDTTPSGTWYAANLAENANPATCGADPSATTFPSNLSAGSASDLARGIPDPT